MPNISIDPYADLQTKTVFTLVGAIAGTYSQIIEGTQKMNSLCIVSDITTVTGTDPTLDIYVQKQLPDGDYTDIAHLTQQIAASKRYGDMALCGAFGVEAAVEDGTLAAGTVNARILGPSIRVKAIIAGTTDPVFTGTVTITLIRFQD